ncbi:MAG TPA: hypothetical protein VMB80_03795 [Candidatus Acidoferrum sp.]|nr:hypothetical protein [Candidatus Acidoferrum sp.]
MPAKAASGFELATATGAHYKNVQVEKLEPDGVIISYTPAQGGMAMTKVYFSELSDEARQKFVKKKPVENQ